MHEVDFCSGERLFKVLAPMFDEAIGREKLTLHILGELRVDGDKVPVMFETDTGRKLYGLVEIVENAQEFAEGTEGKGILSSFIGGSPIPTLPIRSLGFSWDADGKEEAEYFDVYMKEAERKGLFNDAFLLSLMSSGKNASFILHG